jgi:hypothetical protein
VPSTGGAAVEVKTLRLSAGDVARGAKELVDFERASALAWSEPREEEKETAPTLARPALLRLLATDAWMPGSIRFGAGRLDVRLTIEVDHDPDFALAEARAELVRQKSVARERLLALLAQLEVDDAPSS